MRPFRFLVGVLVLSFGVWAFTGWLHQQDYHTLDTVAMLLGFLVIAGIVGYRLSSWWPPDVEESATSR